MEQTLTADAFRAEYAELKAHVMAFEMVAALLGVDLGDQPAETESRIRKAARLPAKAQPSSVKKKAAGRKPARGPGTARIRPTILEMLAEGGAPMTIKEVEAELEMRNVQFGENVIGATLRQMKGVVKVRKGLYGLADAPDKAEPSTADLELIESEEIQVPEHLQEKPSQRHAYRQGYGAPPGTECVYHEGTSLGNAWQEGQDDADEARTE